MLSHPDLSSFDLDGLSAGLLALTQRQHRCLKLADQIGVPPECQDAAAEIDNLDRDAAIAAEAQRLVSHLCRFRADEGHVRPGGLLRKAMAVLGRATAGASR